MRIESAIEYDDWLEVIIDGRRFHAGEKYTILELGYAVYLMDQNDDDWLRENGDIIPADPSDSRSEFKSGDGILITADPTLVALAIESWWSRNGVPKPQGVPLPIPTAYEAIEIVRNRKILNDFNEKMTGIVPGLEIIAKRGRKMGPMKKLRRIFEKTKGHCHFCGDPIEFEKRGWHDEDLAGYWEVDHVIQRDKGGTSSVDNYLPACTRCNRLRWHRKGEQIRELLLLGLIAKDEIRKNTLVGKELIALRQKRLMGNIERRKRSKQKV